VRATTPGIASLVKGITEIKSYCCRAEWFMGIYTDQLIARKK
jgi:hypothetical protein